MEINVIDRWTGCLTVDMLTRFIEATLPVGISYKIKVKKPNWFRKREQIILKIN